MVKRGALESRFDSNTYHPERIAVVERLRLTKWKLSALKFVAKFNKVLVSENPDNLPYIGLENIESNTGVYIPTEEREGFGTAVRFEKGKVLFPKLRPYLNKVYFSEFDGLCSTEFHILDSHVVDNQYLVYYLSSKFIVNQTKWLMSGNTLPRLQTADIENLLVPILPLEIQAQIVEKFNEAYEIKRQKETEARALLASIDGYLLEQLGIKLPEKIETKPTFLTRFKDLQGKRFDPKNYLPQNQALYQILFQSKYDTKPLKSLTIQSVAGDWGIDEAKEGFSERLVIRATEFDNLHNLNLGNSRVKYRYVNDLKLSKMDLQTGDLLIEKSGGSEDQPVGRIAIITEELAASYRLAYSNFIHKIRINEEVNSAFLFYFLKTIHNIKITDTMQSQTNGIRNLIMREFLNIPVSLPTLEVQIQIADHISQIRAQAKALETEAREVLATAKAEVERVILG